MTAKGQKTTQTADRPQPCGCSGARANTPECAQVRAVVSRAKTRLINDYAGPMEEHGKLLQLAVTEAEALAWQTEFPHLFFPTLAVEKADAALQWHKRQRNVRRKAVELAFAA